MPIETTEKLRKRVIKSFMDIIIISKLKDGSMSGYDIISHIHKRFGILMSPGTVYNLMYSLERNGLIKGVQNQRKTVFILTEQGEQRIKTIAKSNGRVEGFLRTMLSIPHS